MLSIFTNYLSAFKAMMKVVEQRINGSKEPLVYTYTAELQKEYSADLRWDSGSIDNTVVTADVVAMDSDLPLKKWDRVAVATGEIPKLGAKVKLSERLMSDIDNMKNKSADASAIAQKLFSSTVKLVASIPEKIQYMYDQALSSGVMLVDDDTNVGTGVRVNFGYSASNMFGAEIAWSETSAKPLDDIRRILKLAKGKGDTISIIKMDDATFDNFSRNTQVKEQFAFFNNYVGANIPAPDLDKVNAMLKNNSQFRVQIQIMDRTVTHERNGIRTTVPTWTENKVVFLISPKVGRLVWGQLAEATRPAKNVDYTTVDGFILVKLWRDNEPFAENTSVQALCLPVIDNAGSIYVLDAQESEALTGQTEDDATITIYDDSTVTVANLVNALNNADVKSKPAATTEMTDVQLISLVNKLSDAKEAILKDILEIPVVSAGADTTSSAATKALLGTATAAGDKTIVSTLWSQVSGPNTAGFSAASALSTNATGLVTGTYVFKLTATDSEGTIASDTISVVATVA